MFFRVLRVYSRRDYVPKYTVYCYRLSSNFGQKYRLHGRNINTYETTSTERKWKKNDMLSKQTIVR